jgi:hypothetical protein
MQKGEYNLCVQSPNSEAVRCEEAFNTKCGKSIGEDRLATDHRCPSVLRLASRQQGL